MRAPSLELPPRPKRSPAASRPSVGAEGPEGCPEAAASTREGHGDLRCPCGSLLGRFVESGLEMKCRRCKRCVVTSSQERSHASRGAPYGVIPRISGDRVLCTCGSLLAKTDAERLWLRCRHCKHEVRIGTCPTLRLAQSGVTR